MSVKRVIKGMGRRAKGAGRRVKRILGSALRPKAPRPMPVDVVADELSQAREEIRTLKSELSSQLSFHGFDLANELSGHVDKIREAVRAEFEATRQRLGESEKKLADTIQVAADTAHKLALLRSELAGQVSFLEHDLFEQLKSRHESLDASLSQIETSILSRHNSADNSLLALNNKVFEAQSSVLSRLNEIETRHKSLDARLGQIETSILSRHNSADNSLLALNNRVFEAQSSVLSRLNEIETTGVETVNAAANALSALDREIANSVAAVNTGLNSRLNQADNSLFVLVNKLSHAESQLLSRLNEVETSSVEAASRSASSVGLADRLGGLENDIHARLNQMENLGFESSNRILNTQGELQNRLVAISSLNTEIQNKLKHLDTNLNSRLNELVVTHVPALIEQMHEVGAIQVDALASIRDRSPPGGPVIRPTPTRVDAFDSILERAKGDFPSVYTMWRQRLDEMSDAFKETKEGNAAHAADVYSRLFRSFVERHIHGAVLDIGCGPFGQPYYLSSYPAELISGIEPLPFPPPQTVQILRGISEYLPFDDAAFGTVISATSLDHCLDLERSLDEMIRVLDPSGKALLWLGSIPGSPKFTPDKPGFEPADRFHLFHFDVAWFEPILNKRFEILERVKLERASYSHVFYALRPLAEVAKKTAKQGRRQVNADKLLTK